MGVTRVDFISANSSEYKQYFQTAINAISNMDIEELSRLLSSLAPDKKRLLSFCVGKDANTLICRLSSGIVPAAMEYIDLFVEHGMTECFSMFNGSGEMPLAIAIKHNADAVIPVLIQHMGQDIRYINSKYRDTPCTLAIRSQNLNLLPGLIALGQDPFTPNGMQMTPEMMIRERCGEEVMRSWVAMTSSKLAIDALHTEGYGLENNKPKNTVVSRRGRAL